MMLKVKNLHFSFPKRIILDNISFSVEKGEIIALIGISGSGKTTLFRLITGILQSESGSIEIQDKPVTKQSMQTTYMRQEDLLLPWRTIIDNLLLFTELGKTKKNHALFLEEAHQLLEQVGLIGYAHAFPEELSGGMRQRVALARALLQNRPLMLLDEPFASLDVIIREQLYQLLKEIGDKMNKTIVMVTHDFRDALALADRILILAEGKIIESHAVTETIKNDIVAKEAFIQKIRHCLLSQSTL